MRVESEREKAFREHLERLRRIEEFFILEKQREYKRLEKELEKIDEIKINQL